MDHQHLGLKLETRQRDKVLRGMHAVIRVVVPQEIGGRADDQRVAVGLPLLDVRPDVRARASLFVLHEHVLRDQTLRRLDDRAPDEVSARADAGMGDDLNLLRGDPSLRLRGASRGRRSGLLRRRRGFGVPARSTGRQA